MTLRGLLNPDTIKLINKSGIFIFPMFIFFSCTTKTKHFKRESFILFVEKELNLDFNDSLNGTFIFLNADFCGSCNKHNTSLIDSILQHRNPYLICSLESNKIQSSFTIKNCIKVYNDTLNMAYRYKLMRDYGIIYDVKKGEVIYSSTFSPKEINRIRTYFFSKN